MSDGVLTPEQEAENNAAWNRHWGELLRRMDLLAEFYNVPKGGWAALALHLAVDHVPGLQVTAATAGRPMEWPPFRVAQLRHEMDSLIASRGAGFSVASAAKVIAKRSEWKPKRATKPWEVLRRKYYEADRRWVHVLKDAAAWQSRLSKNPFAPISSQEEMGSQ